MCSMKKVNVHQKINFSIRKTIFDEQIDCFNETIDFSLKNWFSIEKINVFYEQMFHWKINLFYETCFHNNTIVQRKN